MEPGEFGIIDSTLREGEQTPGLRLDDADRLAIVAYLHQAGVEEIELGIATPAAAYLPGLLKKARSICAGTCRLALWSRCVAADIAFAAACRPDILSISIPASDLHIRERLGKDRQWIIAQLRHSIRQALNLGIPLVAVGMEDGSRADSDFLLRLCLVAEEAGAGRVRLADTVGICTPGSMGELIRPLRKQLRIDLGVHCHNDFGMATANSMAALEAGANWLDATVLGLGERSGNCRLEEILGYFALVGHKSSYRPEILPVLCRFVAAAGGTAIPANHPIVGERIFTCETGLHQHGLHVNPATYEPYAPSRVGSRRALLFGRKTGRRAIILQLATQGVQLSELQAERLAASLRSRDAAVSGEELARLAAAHL